MLRPAAELDLRYSGVPLPKGTDTPVKLVHTGDTLTQSETATAPPSASVARLAKTDVHDSGLCAESEVQQN